ncbi:MAG TPA: hypothetical protein VFT29_01035 [Gemmatimonadaceae bacterium]|nr:hypothetical protein [Gemmatimonadaceae bacterium]
MKVARWPAAFAAAFAAFVTLAAFARTLPAQQQDTTVRRQQRMLDSLAAALAAIQARLDSAAARPAEPPQAAPAQPPSGSYMNIGFVTLVDGGTSTEQDVPSIELGDHDPVVRGFTMPNSELSLDGAVDPYFKGFANIVYKIGERGETELELEEAYALTTSLPKNLQVKFGQYLTDFGRHNTQHPHAWAFVDLPLVLGQMFGRDGLRSQGVRLSWLAPTPWYTEAMVTVANSTNETTFSFRADESFQIHGGVPVDRPVQSFEDMLVVPRIATSFDITDTQTLVLGTSAAFGPNNSGFSARTQIYGVDGYWKWKSARASQGFPFVSLQGEALSRRYVAEQRLAIDDPAVTLPADTIWDSGSYLQGLWGIRPRIVAGLRGDWVRPATEAAFVSPQRLDRFRLSPNFTWYPTEFSKLRLQYNYDNRSIFGTDHSLWVQFEFLLGAHAAHKF